MTDFTVHTPALRTFARVLSNDTDAAAGYDYQALVDAMDYVDSWVALEPGDTGLLLSGLNGRTTQLATALGIDYRTLSTTLLESGDGLARSASSYDNTERANNEQIDSVFPDVEPESLGNTDPGGAAADPQPRAALTAPGTDGGIPDLVNYIIQPTALASPSAAVLKVLSLAGLDPIGWLTEKLAGSLDPIARVKNAVEQLSSFDSKMNVGVCDGAALMLTQWTGHAADGAQSYFAKLSDALDEHSYELATIAHLYNEAVTTIGQFEQILGSLVSLFCDDLVAMAAAAAAAACLSMVPGIDLLAVLYGAARAYKLFQDWEKITKAFDVVMTSTRGIIALCTLLDSSLSKLDLSAKLPSIGYYNPAQGDPPKYDTGPPPVPHSGSGPVPA